MLREVQDECIKVDVPCVRQGCVLAGDSVLPDYR
jgi:hypothetical protein